MPCTRLFYRFLSIFAFLILALTLSVKGALAQTGSCGRASGPGATLLFPYFEVEPDLPEGKNTLISINNASASSVMAHVVMWTNCSIPVLAFDLLLAPDAVRSINLRQVVENGRLPSSTLGEAGSSFPTCADPLEPNLGELASAQLRARLSGQPDPMDGLCYADSTAGIMTGFLTVDVVKDCSDGLRTPLDDGYFGVGDSGLAADNNVLWGDFQFIHGEQNSAQGFQAVALPAGEEVAPETAPSFYGRGDRRQVLPEFHRARFLNSDAFRTDVIYWVDDLNRNIEPGACSGTSGLSCGSRTFFAEEYDQGGNHRSLSQPDFSKSVGRLEVGGPELDVVSSFGTLKLCQESGNGNTDPDPHQSWFMPVLSAHQRFSVGLESLHLCPSDLVPVVASAEVIPPWLTLLIARVGCQDVTNPPISFSRYLYHGEIVYYRPPFCCDAFSDLYDENGNLLCHPDGGITGHGDGQCPDFFQERSEEVLIWIDPRTRPADDEPFRLRRVRSETELVAYMKQGLIATYGGGSPFLYGPGGGGQTSPPDPSGGLPLSQTNVQEAGVDEEDRIKSDGHHLFILNNHQSLREPPPGPVGGERIRILEIDAGQPSATALSELEVALAEYQRARGIYLRAEASQLIVTASSLDLGWGYWYSPLAWLGAKSTVASVDVSDPVHPEQAATLELEGDIISSRRIGDVVYLATRFQPYIQGLEPFDPSSPESVAAIERIEAAQLDDLVPSYRWTASSEWRPLVRPSDCYLPTEEAPVVAADLISLVAIDLDTMEVASSKCFVGATETLYVSPVSIYLASTRYEYSLVEDADGVPWTDYRQPEVETDLHKFSLSSGLISYQASGSVDGHLGWNILRKPFRLSESGDDLRVITYTDELTADRSPVAITVLRDTGDDELEVLSRLPNQQRPDPIGKPGEQLYATRFVGDRAYLVTFLVTDPLYVIDLSRPEDPFVAGELEITGYSDYLHLIDDDYVLGVGKDAIPDPGADFRGAWYQGLKISLYDVSDPNNPFEADAAILGKRGSEAPVLQDHRAFTFLQGEGSNARVAIGAVVHERTTPGTSVHPWTFFGWSYSGLHLFEVDTAEGKILRRGEMRVEEYEPTTGSGGEWPLIYGDDRSVLAGDAIFYVHGDDVYTSLWSNPGLFEGPK